ncbi:MAG: transposase [Streptosporangiaceae bacterium]|nr:transposase [Streptosporangiaceae bacterium]
MGKKRLKVEVLLAAAALPSPPPPLAALLPDLSFSDLLSPADPFMNKLLALLPQADLYLQDEVQIALHPTITRVWCRKGRRGQRLVQAPGRNEKQWGLGLVDWRDGWVDWAVAAGRQAAPCCAQVRRAVERSRARGRRAIIVLDNLGIHTWRGSTLLRDLLEELQDQLTLVYTPPYDPDANRIEWLWRVFRAAVTHNHQRQTMAELLEDAATWQEDLTASAVLQHIGSPFARHAQPAGDLTNAA